MSQDFENSYSTRPVRFAGDVAKILRQHTSPVAAGSGVDGDAVDKENITHTSDNNVQDPAAVLLQVNLDVVHATKHDSKRDFFGFVASSTFCTASVSESSLFEEECSGSSTEVSAKATKPTVVTLKSRIAAAAFCANCSCVVLGTDSGTLTFATTSGKILFSQKLLPPTASSFSSIVVVPRKAREDIIILSSDGKLFLFHQVDFKTIQGFLAAKDLGKLAEYRKQMTVSTVESSMPGPHHSIAASYVVGSSTALWVAVCSSKPAGKFLKFWRREGGPDSQQRLELVEHEAATAKVIDQAAHAGIVKIEWTKDGKWFMLLGSEGRLSWWTAASCQLVKTLDEFNSILDFALLETGRNGEDGQAALPRIAIQKRRSSGVSVDVLFLDGKKIRHGFGVSALPPNTRLLKSFSMPAAFFTVAVAAINGPSDGCLEFQCYSDPSIRMQQLQIEGGLDAAMNVADKFAINPVGFLEASMQKLISQVNNLDNDTSPDAAQSRMGLVQQMCDVANRIEDDWTAIESLYCAAVGHLDVVHALHAKAAERFGGHQASSQYSELEKRRFRETYLRLKNRWQVFEQTFCGSVAAAAEEIKHTASSDAPSFSGAVNKVIDKLKWQSFRQASVVDIIARLLSQRMVGQAQAIWRFYTRECHDSPDMVKVLQRFDAAAVFLAGGDAASSSFLAQNFASFLCEVLPTHHAESLEKLRDWIFVTAARMQARNSLPASKMSQTLLSTLDPRYWSTFSGTILSGNSPSLVLQRIEITKLFKSALSSDTLRRAGLKDQPICSAEQLQQAVSEVVYLSASRSLSVDSIYDVVVTPENVMAIALEMVKRAVVAADVVMQVNEHVRPYLQRHSMKLSHTESAVLVDRIVNTLDLVLCSYVDHQLSHKEQLEEQLDRLQMAGSGQASNASDELHANSSFSDAERVEADENAEAIANLRASIQQSLARSMRAIRLVEDLTTKAERALNFLASLRPENFSDSIFQFAEDASTWGSVHQREQLLEQRRLLDIYGILAKYGVLSGCSSWTFSVTKPNHARQLLGFITSQIDMGSAALHDALVLAGAYPNFNKLDIYVDFLTGLVSQPLPVENRESLTQPLAESREPTTPTSAVRSSHHHQHRHHHQNGKPSTSAALRVKLAGRVLKAAGEHGREFRAEICEEVVTTCSELVNSIRENAGVSLEQQVHSFLDGSLADASSSGGFFCDSAVESAHLCYRVGLLALTQLQNDTRATQSQGAATEWASLLSTLDVASLRRQFERCAMLATKFRVIASPSDLAAVQLSGSSLGSSEDASMPGKIMCAVQSKKTTIASAHQLAKLLGVTRSELQASLAELVAQSGNFPEATATCLNSLDIFESSASARSSRHVFMPSSSSSNSFHASAAVALSRSGSDSRIQSSSTASSTRSVRHLSETETMSLKRVALAMCRYTATHTSEFDESQLHSSGSSSNHSFSPEYARQLLEKALVGASPQELSDLLQLHRVTDIVAQVFAKTTHGDFGKLWGAHGGEGGYGGGGGIDDVPPNAWSKMHFVDSNSVLETSRALQKAVKFAMAAVALSVNSTQRNGAAAAVRLSNAPNATVTGNLKAATHTLVEYLVDNGAEQLALHILAAMYTFSQNGFILSPEPRMKSHNDICESLFPKILRNAHLDIQIIYGYVNSLLDERSRRAFRSKFIKNAIKSSLRTYDRLYKLSELGFALSSSSVETAVSTSSASSKTQFQDLGVSAYWWLLLDVRAHISIDTASFSKDPKAYICNLLIGGSDGGRLWGQLDFTTVLKLTDTYCVSRDFVCLRYIEYMLRLSNSRRREAMRHELVGKIVDLLLTPPTNISQALQSDPSFDPAGLRARPVANGKNGGFADFAGYAAVASGALLPSIDKLSFRLQRIRELRDTIALQISGTDYAHLRHVFTVVREAELAVHALVRRCGCEWRSTDAGQHGADEPNRYFQHMGWDAIRILDALIDCRRQASSNAKKAKSAEGAKTLAALENIDFHALIKNPRDVLLGLTSTDTIDILNESLIWAPIVRDAVSQAQLADVILTKRFSKEQRAGEWLHAGASHDIVCSVEADLRRIGSATPASCDVEYPAKFAVSRCEWVADQCPAGRLKIKALHVGLDMTAEWLQHSREKRLPDQLDAIEKAKILKGRLCHARVIHILSEHVDQSTICSEYEPYLDNPQRLLCLVYHNMSPATLTTQREATDGYTATHESAGLMSSVDVHGVVFEIASCYGPTVRLGPLIQHLIKHWLKNGPVAPVKKSAKKAGSHQANQMQRVQEIDEGAGETTEESTLTFTPSMIGAEQSGSASSAKSVCVEDSPATTMTLSSDDSRDQNCSGDSPSPFNFNKVLSSKPGSRATRLSYSSSPANTNGVGEGTPIDSVFDDSQGGHNHHALLSGNLFEPTPEEQQHLRHLEVVAKIAFVIQAPFGGATWTPQRRAEFLIEYAFRAHPQKASLHLKDSSSLNAKGSYEASAIALHSLFHITDDPRTIELAAKALGSSLDQVMTFWQQCMYMRVFDQLRLPYNIDRLSSMRSNPLGFVRGLWRDYRHQGAMLPLIGRMMLDFGVVDAMLWSALLQQMLKLGMYRRLTCLLQGVTSTVLLRNSPQVGQVCAAVIKKGIHELHLETAGRSLLSSTTTAGVSKMTGVSNQTQQTSLILNHIVTLTERSVEYFAQTENPGSSQNLLFDPALVTTLAEVCWRLEDWDLAYRCCAAMAVLCNAFQHPNDSKARHQLQEMIRGVLSRMRDLGTPKLVASQDDAPSHQTSSSSVEVSPLGQFLRHIPAKSVGPASARLLAAIFSFLAEEESRDVNPATQLIGQLRLLPQHWAQYQEFVSTA